jgi:epoxide hydrolase-like predicted phosphatase
MSAPPAVCAVIFDLGGVVFESPLALIREYEERHALPAGFIARIVGGYGGTDGAWHRLERGELTLAEFCERFDEDVASAGQVLSTAGLMREMHERAAIRPAMLGAIRALRKAGLKVGALTNNWLAHEGYDQEMQPLREEFHAFVESCKVRLRKPDPRIYQLACEKLAVSPGEAVFLDDIGGNLKAARALGMTTIKVEEPDAAIRELERVVGLTLG